jgi:hypothetical protein
MSARNSLPAALQTALATLAIGTALAGGDAGAATVVVPNAQSATEGNSSNYGPFFSTSVRYQQVYSSSQFPYTGPLTITQISFRPDGSVGDPTLFFVNTNVHVELSTTAKGPSTLSTVFADNVGADHQTVYDGAISNAPVSGPAGGPKNFTVTINLSTPFVYDAIQGRSLLLEVLTSSNGISAPLDAQSPSSDTAHVDAASAGASSGTYVAAGLVTQFQYTPAPKTVWSQNYAFAWADQPTAASYTPSTLYSYNHAGAGIQITRAGTGVYNVHFESFGAINDGGNVQVTGYGSFGGGNGKYCKVSIWSSDTVTVLCFDAVGVAADSYFTVLFLKVPSQTTAVAYAWANNPTSASYMPDTRFSYNPAGGAITATRQSTGAYTMTWSGLGNLGFGSGHPHVTAYDSSNKRCEISSWEAGEVSVYCFDSSGNRADSRYSVLFLRPQPTDDGLAYGKVGYDVVTATYRARPGYSFNPSGGAVTATRSAAGVYAVNFAGFSGVGLGGGHVHVNGSDGSSDVRCAVISWSSETVNVRCSDWGGASYDTEFTVLFIKPVTAPEPGRLSMLASGVALLGLLARQRRQGPCSSWVGRANGELGFVHRSR